MAARFGRNKARRARAEIAAAQAEVAVATTNRLHAEECALRSEGQARDAAAQLRGIQATLEDVLGRSHVTLPERTEEWQERPPFDSRLEVDLGPEGGRRGLRALMDFDPNAPAMAVARRIRETLYRLEVGGFRDECARAVHIRVRWRDLTMGQALSDLYLSERAWRSGQVVDRVAAELGERIAQELAKHITGARTARAGG